MECRDIPASYAFGPFRLDVEGETLFRGTKPVALSKRAVALLRLLVERAGALVSKDALIEAAWPNLVVEDGNLTVQIAALRRALGEVPGGEDWIVTLPRRGYRFVGPVVTKTHLGFNADSRNEELAISDKARVTNYRPSIAVLPFVEYGGVPDSVIGSGIAEDVVAVLASLPDLFVISRNSTMKYRQTPHDLQTISRELGVRYIVSGSVRRRGDNLRVSAELADTESLEVIAAEKFEGETSDLFALHDRLTERVLQMIAPHIHEAELRRVRSTRTASLDAYGCMLRGLDLLYRLDQAEFEQARQMFQQSIRLDENYAAPHAFTALWHSIRLNQGWSSDRNADLKMVDEFAAAALRRDPNNLWGLAVSGYLRAFLFRDFNTAFELLDRALRAGPNSAFAWARSGAVFNFVNEPAEARRRLEQALRLSPFDPHIFFTHGSLAHASYLEGDYKAAIGWGRQSYAENSNYTANLRFLAASLAAAGLIEEAHRIGASLRRLEPGFTVRKFVEGYAYQDEHLRNQLGQHLMSAGLPE